MKWQKIIAVIALILVMGAAEAAPRQPLAGVSVTGYSVETVRPHSMRELLGMAVIRVRNKGGERTLRNVSAVLYLDGKKVARGRCSDIVLKPGQSSVRVKGYITLVEDVSLFSAMKAALSFNPSAYTADIVCSVVDADGKAQTLVRRGVALGAYVK